VGRPGAAQRLFICTLDHAQLADLTKRVKDMIDTDTDSVHVFRQCLTCWDDVSVLGQATVQEEPYYWAVM